MASLNKAILMGNLVADPELKQTPSGVSVCSLRGEINITDCPRRKLCQGVFGHGFDSRRFHQIKKGFGFCVVCTNSKAFLFCFCVKLQ